MDLLSCPFVYHISYIAKSSVLPAFLIYEVHLFFYVFSSFSDCPNNGLCCFDGCADRCVEGPSQGKFAWKSNEFEDFELQNCLLGPEGASAQIVPVEEPSEPKGYSYPVPGSIQHFSSDES